MAEIVELEFNGYRREMAKEKTPLKSSGVFCVYRASYNTERNTVKLQEIIYIGNASNVQEEIKNTEMVEVWTKHLRFGEELCYSYAAVENDLKERVEAALIYKHKPVLNGNYKRDFPFDDIVLKLSGKTALLSTKFQIKRR